MSKLIIFKADSGEIQKHRTATASPIGESFYRVGNFGAVRSLTDTIAEYYDASDKPLPSVGFRLTETVPNGNDTFRDAGWEVVRVDLYPGSDGEFSEICICYCVYSPLPVDEQWVNKAHRLSANPQKDLVKA